MTYPLICPQCGVVLGSIRVGEAIPEKYTEYCGRCGMRVVPVVKKEAKGVRR